MQKFVYKKKVRGLKRKFSSFKIELNQLTEVFPNPEQNGNYWHVHMPVSDDFIDSIKTPGHIRTNFIKEVIYRTEHLFNIKPDHIYAKVVACISLPKLLDSQIIIFFNEEYYKTFFDRNDGIQQWIKLEESRYIKKFNIEILNKFNLNVYKEIINCDDYEFINELWFFGDVE